MSPERHIMDDQNDHPIPDETPQSQEVNTKDPKVNHHAVCTGYGGFDSHAPEIEDRKKGGMKKNRNKNAGKPYDAINAKAIIAMVKNPPQIAKPKSQWIIPSTYNAMDARTHAVQFENGVFPWLPIDVDETGHDLAKIKDAVRKTCGDVAALIYTTASATKTKMKWRVLLPLKAPIKGQDYKDTQEALNDLLKREGITADSALARPGQLVYLPNRGAHYEHEIIKADRLAITADHPIAQRMHARELEREQAKQAANAAAVARAQKREASGNSELPGEHYCDTVSVAQALAAHGYENAGGENWIAPDSTSGSAAMRDYGTHWVYLGSSLNSMGQDGKNGGRWGDAWDIHVWHAHGGDMKAAAREYGKTMPKPNPQPATQPASQGDPQTKGQGLSRSSLLLRAFAGSSGLDGPLVVKSRRLTPDASIH